MKHKFRIVMLTKERHPKYVTEIEPVWTDYCTLEEAKEQAEEFWKEHGSRADWWATLSFPA